MKAPDLPLRDPSCVCISRVIPTFPDLSRMNRENPAKLGTAWPYGVPGMTNTDADTPETRLRTALAVKAARHLMGHHVKTQKQQKAGPISVDDLAALTANTRNHLAKDRIQGIEQIGRDKDGKLPTPARPWELAAIVDALGGREALLEALEPLVGPMREIQTPEDASDQSPAQPQLAAVMERLNRIDAALAVFFSERVLVAGARQDIEAVRRQLAEGNRPEGA